VAGFLFNAAKNGNVTAQIFWLKTRAKWREVPTELRHSGAIARKDLSEISDEELMDMIYTVGSEAGLIAKDCGVKRHTVFADRAEMTWAGGYRLMLTTWRRKLSGARTRGTAAPKSFTSTSLQKYMRCFSSQPPAFCGRQSPSYLRSARP
jgi:hypothetical protein